MGAPHVPPQALPRAWPTCSALCRPHMRYLRRLSATLLMVSAGDQPPLCPS